MGNRSPNKPTIRQVAVLIRRIVESEMKPVSVATRRDCDVAALVRLAANVNWALPTAINHQPKER